MCNQVHNNIRDTSVVNIYIYFRYIYNLKIEGQLC